MRHWRIMVCCPDEVGLPNMELARAWTEAGAWRRIRRADWPERSLAWLEVRHRRDAMLTHAELLDQALAEL